jgi:hypothetical protein
VHLPDFHHTDLPLLVNQIKRRPIAVIQYTAEGQMIFAVMQRNDLT